MSDTPTPSLGPGGLSLFGVIIVALWECLKLLPKVIKFPVPKVLNGKSVPLKTEIDEIRGKLEALNRDFIQLRTDENLMMRQFSSDFNTLRDVEFPAHAKSIRALELAVRGVQDTQVDVLEKLKDSAESLAAIGRTVRSLRDRSLDGAD